MHCLYSLFVLLVVSVSPVAPRLEEMDFLLARHAISPKEVKNRVTSQKSPAWNVPLSPAPATVCEPIIS